MNSDYSQGNILVFVFYLVTYLGRIRSLSSGGTEFVNLIQSVPAGFTQLIYN